MTAQEHTGPAATAAGAIGTRILIVGGRAAAAGAKGAAARAGAPMSGRLARLGCEVVGVATTADDALALAAQQQPALALVDLHASARGGGVETAARLQAEANVGVVFFGAAPDAALLARALAIAPAGPLAYLHDPCSDLELSAAIGIAVRRAGAERELRSSKRAHHTLLAGIREGVIAVDNTLAVRYMNARAEALTGWSNEAACGRPLDEVLQLREEAGGRPLNGAMLAEEASGAQSAPDRAGRAWDGTACVVTDRAGNGTPVAVSTAAIGEAGQSIGLAVTLHGLAENRSAERRLRASEERFRSLAALSSDWYWEQDRDFRFTAVSGGLTERTGVNRSGIIGKTRWELPTVNMSEAQWREHRALLEAHRPFRDLVIRRPDAPDGRQYWVKIGGEPVFDGEGRFQGYRGVGRDVTERMAAQQAVADSLATMHATLELANDGIVIADRRRGVVHANRRFLEIWGLDEVTLSGEKQAAQRRHMIAQAADPQGMVDALRRLDEHPEAESSDLLEMKDGRLYEATSRPLMSADGPSGRVWSLRDVTEQRRAAAALVQSEARLKLFIERAPAALAAFDRDMRYIVASRRWLEDYGLGEASIAGRSHYDVFPEIPERWKAIHRRALAGEVVRDDADRFDRADGRVQWLSWEVMPWHTTEGEVGGIVMVTEDISQLRQTAEQIKSLNASLERRVAERTAELAAARDEAQRLARVKSEFLANMSHEIRTPLHAVLGLAGIGLRESAGRTSQLTFQRILDSGEHLLGVINTILDISKVEAGKQQAEQRPFRLADVLAKAEEFVVLAAQKKGLVQSVSVDPALPRWVQGDALRLQQILVNLLSNAVKFTDCGSVRLAVRRAAGNDEPGAQGGTADLVCFEVTDTGIGIAPAQQDKLFTPFEQLDSSTTRRFGGTGLGLMLSQSLAALMGGRISVASRLGEGSTFTLMLRLPAAAAPGGADDASPAQDGAPAAAGRRLQGLHVLAVDDVDINRMILEDLLRLEGARARVVDSAAAALQALAEPGAAFDVVLMDIQMPHIDGYEAARRVRAVAPALPIIGLTAHALPEERERCLAAGMVEHVTKPVDVAALVEAIRRHVPRAAAMGVAAPDAAARAPQPAPAPRPSARGTGAPAHKPRALRLIESGTGATQPAFTTATAVGSQATPIAGAAASDAGETSETGGGFVDWTALAVRYAALPGFVDKLAAKALATQQRVPGQLRLAARAGDLAALRALAHEVAGMAGNLQAPRLTELARAAEAAIVHWRGPDAALTLASELADGVEDLLRELQQYEQRQRA